MLELNGSMLSAVLTMQVVIVVKLVLAMIMFRASRSQPSCRREGAATRVKASLRF